MERARSVVAVEAVPGLGVPHDLRGHRRRLGRHPQRLDVVDRDAPVEVAEQAEPRGLQAGCQVDQRRVAEPAGGQATAVEGDGRAQRACRRGGQDDAATHAEPDDAGLLGGEAGVDEVGQGGVDVRREGVGGQLAEERQHGVEIVVGEHRRALPVEQRRVRRPSIPPPPAGCRSCGCAASARRPPARRRRRREACRSVRPDGSASARRRSGSRGHRPWSPFGRRRTVLPLGGVGGSCGRDRRRPSTSTSRCWPPYRLGTVRDECCRTKPRPRMAWISTGVPRRRRRRSLTRLSIARGSAGGTVGPGHIDQRRSRDDEVRLLEEGSQQAGLQLAQRDRSSADVDDVVAVDHDARQAAGLGPRRERLGAGEQLVGQDREPHPVGEAVPRAGRGCVGGDDVDARTGAPGGRRGVDVGVVPCRDGDAECGDAALDGRVEQAGVSDDRSHGYLQISGSRRSVVRGGRVASADRAAISGRRRVARRQTWTTAVRSPDVVGTRVREPA